MPTSSPAQKSRTCRARQASDCHLPHGKAANAAAEHPCQLSEQAHARSEQGSERTVCINAFRGAFYRAVQCCAVRCSEVHWPCLQLLRAGSCNLCCCRLLSRAWLSGERPRLKESGRGGHCSAEESIGSSPGAMSRQTPCRPRGLRHFFNREFPVRECESVDLPLLKKLCEAPHFFPLHFYTLTHATE